jgi:hypothetical protein
MFDIHQIKIGYMITYNIVWVNILFLLDRRSIRSLTAEEFDFEARDWEINMYFSSYFLSI